MFRKHVDPKVAAIATLITLGAIQWAYWRNLVYEAPHPGGGPMGGAGPMGGPPSALGLEAVSVENWAGDEPGYADGPGWAARFAGPNALAEAADGTLLVCDSRNHCIRSISPSGKVATVAGGDAAGRGGSAVGPAGSARFRYPSGLAVGKDGAVFISDTGNNRLCRLKSGQVEVFAGGTVGMADGEGAAARFNNPGALALDRSGMLWVLDTGNRKLRRVDAEGKVSTPAKAPAEISATLGMQSRAEPETISSADQGSGPVLPSIYKSGVRSAAALLPTGARVFGDLTRHVVYLQRDREPPLLIAGRIDAVSVKISDHEGAGHRCTFATPAAFLARQDGTVIVADYDSNRIRRLRLPAALIQ